MNDINQRFREVVDLIEKEFHRAREKHPGNRDLVAAMVEEAGEALRAVLQLRYEGGMPSAVTAELVQTAATCIRALVEGDAHFGYTGYDAAHDEGHDKDLCPTKVLAILGSDLGRLVNTEKVTVDGVVYRRTEQGWRVDGSDCDNILAALNAFSSDVPAQAPAALGLVDGPCYILRCSGRIYFLDHGVWVEG